MCLATQNVSCPKHVSSLSTFGTCELLHTTWLTSTYIVHRVSISSQIHPSKKKKVSTSLTSAHSSASSNIALLL